MKSLSDTTLADLVDKLLLYFAQMVISLGGKVSKSPPLPANSELNNLLGESFNECLLKDQVLVKIQAAVNDDTNKKKIVLCIFETVSIWTMTAQSRGSDIELIANVRSQLFEAALNPPSAISLSRMIELVSLAIHFSFLCGVNL